jgi:hypothetical protein
MAALLNHDESGFLGRSATSPKVSHGSTAMNVPITWPAVTWLVFIVAYFFRIAESALPHARGESVNPRIETAGNYRSD